MNFILNVFRGILVGIANIIPGVSGGTMAVILGIYDKLTESIGDFIPNKQKRFTYFMFLSALAIGAAIGVIIFAKIFVFLFANDFSKQLTFLVFAGLILGAIPFIIKLHHDMKPNFVKVSLFLFGFLALFITSIYGGDKNGLVTMNLQVSGDLFGIFKITPVDFQYGLWLFIMGILSAFAMVLPGFSGSAFLVSLGEYSNILHFIDERMIIPLIFVALGAIPGVFLSAKLMSMLIKKYPAQTYYCILGLVTGSAYQVISGLQSTFEWSIISILFSIIAVVAGFVLSFLITKIKH